MIYFSVENGNKILRIVDMRDIVEKCVCFFTERIIRINKTARQGGTCREKISDKAPYFVDNY